jgi:iron(III) transport system ATP-binding protein
MGGSRVQHARPAPSDTRLELHDIVHAYDGVPVLDGVSLELSRGEVTCLLGPSGCGKSTLLRIAAGVERQQAGRVVVDGEVVSEGRLHAPPERRRIGLMFQDFALFPHLNVAENVAFGMTGSGPDKAERSAHLLSRVGLDRHGARYPHQLSGGEQQRVALVRALAPRPPILLMDEPFSGLDNRLRDGIRDDTLALLKEEDTAVLLVTHEPNEAMRMADEIALMRDGRIVQQGAPYNVYTRPVDRAAVAFFSDTNVLKARVEGALAMTPFGRFLAPGVPDGTDVDIVFRPQHVRIDFDRGAAPAPTPKEGTPARAEVVRSRFMGSESLVEFRLQDAGVMLKATVPNVFLPSPGTVLFLRVPRDRCFVFPASRQG